MSYIHETNTPSVVQQKSLLKLINIHSEDLENTKERKRKIKSPTVFSQR